MATTTRCTYNVDGETGALFEPIRLRVEAQQLRLWPLDKRAGSHRDLFRVMLRLWLEHEPNDEWIAHAVAALEAEDYQRYRHRRLAAAEERIARRRRGEHAKPRLSNRQLRKDEFTSDADFDRQIPPEAEPPPSLEPDPPPAPLEDEAIVRARAEHAALVERTLAGEGSP